MLQEESIRKMDAHNATRALNRQEWLQALVRCAVAVYGPHNARQRTVDVAAALVTLLDTNVRPALPPEAYQDSNRFRGAVCYTKPVSDVLEASKESVRNIFERYAEVSQERGDTLRNDGAMSIGEWLTFLQHLGLFEAGQLTLLTAKNIFLWSRLRVFAREKAAQKQNAPSGGEDGGDESGGKGGGERYTAADFHQAEGHLRHLSLGDFYEALVRLATLISLPTDEEIAEAGAQDAGDLLIGMQRDAPSAFAAFIASHKPPASRAVDATGWTKSALAEAPRTVHHLIALVVRIVEFNTSARDVADNADGVVQEEEIRRFLRMRSQGGRLLMKATLEGGVDFGAAMAAAHEKRVSWAAALKIQLARRAKLARRTMREKMEAREALEEEGRRVRFEEAETETEAEVEAQAEAKVEAAEAGNVAGVD